MKRQEIETSGSIGNRGLGRVAFGEVSPDRESEAVARGAVGNRQKSAPVFVGAGNLSSWPTADVLKHRFGGASRWAGRKWVSVFRPEEGAVSIEMIGGRVSLEGSSGLLGDPFIGGQGDQASRRFDDYRFFSSGEGEAAVSFGNSDPPKQGVGGARLVDLLATNLFEGWRVGENAQVARYRSRGWKR